MAKGKNNDVISRRNLISDVELQQTRQALINSHADLVVQGMLDKDVREQLKRVIEREYDQVTKGSDEAIEYIISETIGTGVIEEILNNESITDIGYNGSQLIIETNDEKIVYDSSFNVSEEYIVRLVNKFANTNNKEFTPKNPIFDGRFENVRINAVHSQNTAPESGTTMSLRVVRPKLVLGKHNFRGLAPMFMLDFLEAGANALSNMVISGTTGTGKTELHKLVSSFIPFKDRILLIEDTPETFMKEMFPDKDVYSWLTTEDLSVTDLIRAGLRNNPAWIMVTETRGKEAYEMIQAVLSGHSIITSLHAVDARAIPSRFVNMAKMGYDFDESSLIDDIMRYFDFGIHLERIEYKGQVIRYLQEVVEFTPDGAQTIFKQRFLNGVYHFETFELSKEFKENLEDVDFKLDFPENFRSERPFNADEPLFDVTVPMDDTDRPNYQAIQQMGTTLDALMGREAESAPIDPLNAQITQPVRTPYHPPVTNTEPKAVTHAAPQPPVNVGNVRPNPSLSQTGSGSMGRPVEPSQEKVNERLRRNKLKINIKGAND